MRTLGLKDIVAIYGQVYWYTVTYACLLDCISPDNGVTHSNPCCGRGRRKKVSIVVAGAC